MNRIGTNLAGLGAAVVMGIAAAGVGTIAGCSSSSKVEARSTTTGQELQDLDAARDKGLLTQKEYDDQKKAILKRSKK